MGILTGLTVVEMAGLGPAPFCAMMLADLGARVIRVERDQVASDGHNVLLRNRESVVIDAKKPAGRDLVLALLEKADVLIEGFRPGVMERLGLGPEDCMARNARLIYGRVTGWGQQGPLAQSAGHDINYVSLVGVTDAIGVPDGLPLPPLNLVGDYGGGGMLLAFGVMAAVWEAQRTGHGQVIDCAMIDGASSLLAEYYSFAANGKFDGPRGTHLLDGGAHFYHCYETSDGRHISIGPLESKFYRLLSARLGIDEPDWFDQDDETQWPRRKSQLVALFKTRTRAEWCELFEGSDACFAPVLRLDEVASHPHIAARRTVIQVDGVYQPAPAPRFSRSESAVPRPQRQPGQDTRAILTDLGVTDERLAALVRDGVIREHRLDEVLNAGDRP